MAIIKVSHVGTVVRKNAWSPPKTSLSPEEEELVARAAKLTKGGRRKKKSKAVLTTKPVAYQDKKRVARMAKPDSKVQADAIEPIKQPEIDHEFQRRINAVRKWLSETGTKKDVQ